MENNERRGRPKEFTEETRPTKYEYKFTNPDNSYEIVKYDYEIHKNGPISVEIFPSENGEEIITKTETDPKEYKLSPPPDNDKLPKSKRRYLNPETGKWVAYFRGRQLGLVD